MTNHFTHNLSRRLQELGVELPETGYKIVLVGNNPERYEVWGSHPVFPEHDGREDWLPVNQREAVEKARMEALPALSFSDMLSLMPKVGEKCGWIPVVCGKCGAAWSLPSHCCGEEPGEMTKSYEFVSHRLLDHFLEGQSDGTSWERAEAYLVSITEVK